MAFKVGDIVTRTTESPKPTEAFGNRYHDKGKVGIVTSVKVNDETEMYKYLYNLNDGFLYDDTEIRLATEYEIRAALRNILKDYKNLVESL